jgi:hypothetical protein
MTIWCSTVALALFILRQSPRKAISPVKKLATYVRGGHVLLLSETCHALIKDTLDFLDDRINTKKSLAQTLAV